MKKILFLLGICLAFVFSAVQAQRTTLVNRNGDEQFANNFTTTGAIPTNIDSFIMKNNEGGMLETSVIGYAKDTALVVTGKISVRFNRHRGILTMGTIIYLNPIVADTGLGAATFTYVTGANGKIYLQVTGKISTAITWANITKRKSVWFVN